MWKPRPFLKSQGYSNDQISATGIAASPEYLGPVTSINTTKCTCTLLYILPWQRWSKEHQGINQRHAWLKPEGIEWPTGQRELKIWAQFPQKADTQYALLGHLTAKMFQTHSRFQWPPVYKLWKKGLVCKWRWHKGQDMPWSHMEHCQKPSLTHFFLNPQTSKGRAKDGHACPHVCVFSAQHFINLTGCLLAILTVFFATFQWDKQSLCPLCQW